MPNDAPTDTEAGFLASYDPRAFERPSITVDVALLSVRDDALWTLLVHRTAHPFKGRLALPGGFVGIDESLDDAAARVLATKGGLDAVFLEQLYTFGAPKRDPRMRIVTVAYYALVDARRFAQARARQQERAKSHEGGGEVGSEGVEVARVHAASSDKDGTVSITDERGQPHTLAFDHAEILSMAIQRVRGKLDYSPIGFQLLPEKFTLLELQKVHETLMGCALNKDSFRRRMLASGQLRATGKSQTGTAHRPAELYRFSKL